MRSDANLTSNRVGIRAGRIELRHCAPIAFVLAIVVVAAGAARADGSSADGAVLPRPANLEPNVKFWSRVYSEVGTDGGFVHDSLYLDVVYATVRFPENSSWRQQQRLITAAVERYRSLLQALARGESSTDADASRVAELWQSRGNAAGMADAASRVRFQRGQADRFSAGVRRSGIWRDYIRRTFADAGVPDALTALPHVESSFDPKAQSHAEAAGLWQFTAPTGRRYMQIDHVVDERLDPYRSTRAAAQLLRQNYEETQSWPLAITAYNHGVSGMRRAVEQLDTRDMGVIAWNYQGRGFGFASRNFYAAFLAALDVESRADSLLGATPADPPAPERVVEPAAYMDVHTLAAALGVEMGTLQAFNPAVREPVWTGDKRWPRGFPVRLPPGSGPDDLNAALATIPESERHPQQIPDKYHRVGPGEALSVIARRYGTSVRELVMLNGLASPNRIRAGAMLRLPGAG